MPYWGSSCPWFPSLLQGNLTALPVRFSSMFWFRVRLLQSRKYCDMMSGGRHPFYEGLFCHHSFKFSMDLRVNGPEVMQSHGASFLLGFQWCRVIVFSCNSFDFGCEGKRVRIPHGPATVMLLKSSALTVTAPSSREGSSGDSGFLPGAKSGNLAEAGCVSDSSTERAPRVAPGSVLTVQPRPYSQQPDRRVLSRFFIVSKFHPVKCKVGFKTDPADGPHGYLAQVFFSC